MRKILLILVLLINTSLYSQSTIESNVKKLTKIYLNQNDFVENVELNSNYKTFEVPIRFKLDTIIEAEDATNFICQELKDKILSKYHNELIQYLPEYLFYLKQEYNIKVYVYLRRLRIIHSSNKMKGKVFVDVKIYYN